MTTVEIKAPAGWRCALDRESPVRDGQEVCKRYGVTLSGSRFEKARRDVCRLDFESYRLGGAVQADRKRLEGTDYTLREQRARRAALERQGMPTGGLDAAIASLVNNSEQLRRRVEAAGDVVNQKDREVECTRLRREAAERETEIEKYRTARLAPPKELEDRLDAATEKLAAAEAGFEVGAAELHRIGMEKGKAERLARRGLATALRERVLPLLAERVRAAIGGNLGLYLRRPERAFTPEVKKVLREAESICAIAGRLAEDGRGNAPFAELLGEDVGDLFYRERGWTNRRLGRRKARAPADGVGRMVM